MRKTIEPQLKIGQVDIDSIAIDLNDRDELPQLLIGLQHIYSHRQTRDAIFDMLVEAFGEKTNLDNGRPGMGLWKILVLCAVRQVCNWNFDKLRDIVNNHYTLRLMLGHVPDDREGYALQTLRDNISRITPAVLDKINQVAIRFGHGIFQKHTVPVPLNAAADSFVVETNVHYPTDISLLWDANRCAIRLTKKLCESLGMSDWRQGDYQARKLKQSLRRITRVKRSTSKNDAVKEKKEHEIRNAYQDSLNIASGQVNKIRKTIDSIPAPDFLSQFQIDTIKGFLVHSDRQIDQIRRRAILGEKIPHNEKVFSIFEPHTEWISKGKAGVPVELGLKVCVVKDQYGLILHHQVMENETDNQIAVSVVRDTRNRFPELSTCSFDKGFHSPENQRQLGSLLDRVILPGKGKLSAERSRIEKDPVFLKFRQKHSAVESTINALENHGLNRCPDRGLSGFKRYVGLSVLARNIQIIGRKIQMEKFQKLQAENSKAWNKRLSACG